jgi:DNA (cytosine-5)-methyltransferase 3A
MRVLSLFDGMSCGRIALERAGIPVTSYYAAEIDKYAIKVSKVNYPDILQLGDVVLLRQMVECGILGKIDLLIGGSPCQGFSFAGKQLAFDDPRSALFFDYVRILHALRKQNPEIKFMLENVKMKKKHLAVITQMLGVKPVLINSALVCAQNRQRYYWANWAISQPDDRGIMLRDIIESGEVDREKSFCIDANYYKGGSLKNYLEKSRRQNNLSPEKLLNVNPSGNGMNGWVYGVDAKAPTLTTNKGEGTKVAFHSDEKRLMVKDLKPAHVRNIKSLDDKSVKLLSSMYRGSQANGQTLIPEKARSVLASSTRSIGGDNSATISTDGITYRKLTPIECERLQTVPDNYTAAVSNSQRYKMLGNGWTVDVIAHIFSEMPR